MAKTNYPTQSLTPDRIVNAQGAQSGVIGLVLCGGAGRRLGGKDKGLLTIDGEIAATLALQSLAPLCEACFISANRNIEVYRRLKLGTVLRDLRPDFPGPLGGMEALAAALPAGHHYERLLLLPCDMPRLPPAVPEKLLDALAEEPDTEIVYARCAAIDHYLCAALRVSALHSVSAQLDGAQFAVRRWYATRKSTVLEFSDALAEGFLNRNSAEDLPG